MSRVNTGCVLQTTSTLRYIREFTVILGPSGAGKSTVLNLLGGMDSGLLPDQS